GVSESTAKRASSPAPARSTSSGGIASVPLLTPSGASIVTATAGGMAPRHEPNASTGAIYASNQEAKRVPDREVFASKWGRSGRPELDDFARWSDEYLAISPDAREAMLARGIDLATTRRAAMLGLIKEDPHEALA